MIITLDKTYYARVDSPLLGYMGETESRTITLQGYKADGADRYILRFSYADGAQYDVDITDGEYTVQASLLRAAGNVKCQVLAVKSTGAETYEYVKKSNVFVVTIKPSAGGDTPVPTYEETVAVLDKVLAAEIAADECIAARDTAVTAAGTATEKAKTAVDKASEAAKSAEITAENASHTAADRAAVETAKADVLSARDTAVSSADTAKEKAQTAIDSTATASTAAETAVQANNAAQTAKTAAEQAATEAEDNKTTAVNAAQTATQAEQTANNAADVAVSARDTTVLAQADVTAKAQTVATSAAQVAVDKQTVQAVAESIPTDYSDLSASVGELKGDLGEVKPKVTDIGFTVGDNNSTFYIADAQGNVIAKVDSEGVHSTDFLTPNGSVNEWGNIKNKPDNLGNPDVVDVYSSEFYIADAQGNVAFKVNKNGVEGLNMSGGATSPFKGMKLITIGDSLSAHDNWQKWLVEWLGVEFDNDENINGKDGHAPMAKGGTAVAPTSADSIYMRSLDAKYYADEEKGTIVIIYAGQNDSVQMGTIDDTPYTDRTITDESNLTFYSSYMGMIENILADIPYARIVIVTQMRAYYAVGMVGTVAPYEGVVRFPDMQSVLNYENGRMNKVNAIKNIAEKYNIPCVDLWNDSGVNNYNAEYWYSPAGGTCGQVHPNNKGYKRMAEVITAKIN